METIFGMCDPFKMLVIGMKQMKPIV